MTMTCRKDHCRSDRARRTMCTAWAVAVFVSAGGTNVAATSGPSPLESGTAGADMALSYGIDALFANPAQLGIARGPKTQLRLFGISGGVHSNSFGWGDYRRYNGATLGATDKAAILGKIPPEGLVLRGDAGVAALAMREGRWGIAFSGFGTGRGTMDRDLFELLLNGNAQRADWNFDQSAAEGMAGWQITLSHGRQVGSVGHHRLYMGGALSLIRGLFYGRASAARASVQTLISGFTGEGETDRLTSTGGTGFGVDLGAAWELTDRAILSVKLENLVSTIHWNREVQWTHYNLAFDRLTLDSFDDSLWTTSDTTVAKAGFSRGLAPIIRLGYGHESGRLRWSAAGSMALAERFSTTKTPGIAAGVEYTPTRFLPLRAGMAVGNSVGFALGLGIGLHIGPWAWDTAVRMDRGFWIGAGRGMTGSTAMDISF